jgi:molecular chaperone GrpE (heat shock protein)
VDSKGDDEKIMRILQNGYRMHDAILRPARVHIGHFEKITE